MEENNKNISDQTEVASETYEPKGIAKLLNRHFRFKERGSTMKKEIVAGLSVFLISVCVLLMNTRIVCETLGSDASGYAGVYLAATIVSFVGTMLLGLICNLPMVQVSSLGLSSVFISMIGAQNGLTYYNLLAVSFLGALAFTVVMAVPASKKFVMNALPAPVRKALPAGTGLYLISYALKSSGIISVSNGTVSTIDFGSLGFLGIAAFVAVVVVSVSIIIFKKLRLAHPYLYGFLSGLLIFYLLGVILGINELFTVDRGYIALGAENMYTIGLGFGGLEWGAVFAEGFDFSAYTGNVFALFVGGILTFFFMGMYESESAVSAAELEGCEVDEKSRGKVLLVSGAVGAVAPLLGCVPPSVGSQSAIAAGDGGKTGLTSVVCGIGYLVAMFSWVFFALFATYTAVVTDYGHATSNSFAEYAQAGFALTDAVMMTLGLFLLRGIKDCDFSAMSEFVPFLGTVAVIAVTQNIVIGAAVGCIFYVILKLFSFRPEVIKSIGVPTGILSAVLLLTLILM